VRTREEILHRFEQWLDDAFAAEPPPAGLDGEILAALSAENGDATQEDRICDSYALWAAMTALTQEVKLQGRTFKELNETLASQASRMAEEQRREAERRCRREILGALIDLRDRLARGLESARAGSAEISRTSWLDRLVAKPRAAGVIAALIKGYELGVERLDQTLEEFGAKEIRGQGQLFDPRRMNAIDSEESDAVPEGMVLEVYRSGYEWNGEAFRPAQVKVSTRKRK
jgi:molecular chaperone GrpE (heat shock protein)